MDQDRESTESASDSRTDRAKSFMNEKYSEASEKIRSGYSQAKEKYSDIRDRMEQVDYGDMLDDVRTYVRSNPGKALLISVGAGFLVGLLLRKLSEGEEDEE